MSVRTLNEATTRVSALDERGAGHAHHHYVIRSRVTRDCLQEVQFQKGPIREVGINGAQNEDLLLIVMDRLVGFQTGEFPCEENEKALQLLAKALAFLQLRTAKHRARGVEGKSEK